MQIIKNIEVDLFNDQIKPEIWAGQNSNAMQVQVRLLAGGQSVTPTGTPRVYVRKTDGTIIYNDCTISGDYVVIQTTTQMTAAKGRNLAELEIMQNSTVLRTPIFFLCVGDSVVDSGAVEGSDEFGALVDALEEVDYLKEHGLKGDAATIQVGTVTTGEPDSAATVTNSGTENDAVFDFSIPKGSTGNGIKSAEVTVEYQASGSGTSIPAGTWSQTIPSVEPGGYLWTRLTIPYTDGGSTVSYSVSQMGATGPAGTVSVDTDAIVEYDTPEEYTPPASGITLKTFLGRVTRGLSNLFSAIDQKLNASQVLTEEEWDTGTVSQRGYLADAKDILDEFAQLNTDLDGKTAATTFGTVVAGLQDLHPDASAYSGYVQVFTTGATVTNAPDDGGDYRYSVGLMIRRNATQHGVIIINRSGGIRSAWYTNEVWRPWG